MNQGTYSLPGSVVVILDLPFVVIVSLLVLFRILYSMLSSAIPLKFSHYLLFWVLGTLLLYTKSSVFLPLFKFWHSTSRLFLPCPYSHHLAFPLDRCYFSDILWCRQLPPVVFLFFLHAAMLLLGLAYLFKHFCFSPMRFPSVSFQRFALGWNPLI